VLFMSLDLGSKLELAVFGVIKLHASNDCLRAYGLRDSVGWGKLVSQKVLLDHFNDHACWHLVEWERVVNTAGPLFCSLDVPLDLRYMLSI
jgi:hypothetical protein